MANNVFGGRPNAVVAKADISFAAAGITAGNTSIIYLVDDPLKSYVPGRPINAVTDFETNKGYYMIPITDMDLSAILVPPISSTPAVTVVNDTFTGAAGNLTGHTPEIGGAITKVWGEIGDFVLVGDGTLKSGSDNVGAQYAYANVFSGANQKATVRAKKAGLSSVLDILVFSLRSDITTSQKTGYDLELWDNSGSSLIKLYKAVDGAATAIYDGVTDVPAIRDGSYHDYTLEVTGSTLTVKMDGTTITTVTDSTLTAGRKLSIGILATTAANSSVFIIDSVIAENL